jgi:hypothetical protein
VSAIHAPWWAEVAQWLLVSSYRHRRSQTMRIEISPMMPGPLLKRALSYQTLCAHCGRAMAPIRQRRGGGYFFATTCPDSVDPACKRSYQGRLALAVVCSTLRGHTPAGGWQPHLL